jgi:hypothetical protein
MAQTPLAAVTRGIAAGLIGTALMTTLQEVSAARRRLAGMAAGPQDHDDGPPPDPWAKAPAPAQLARRLVVGLVGRDVPASAIPVFTNAVHWGYGTALGGIYGLVESSVRSRPAVHGPLFGMAVWASSYATLVPLGLYQPPWRYKPRTIAKDVSYHLAYGSGVAAGYAALARARP